MFGIFFVCQWSLFNQYFFHPIFKPIFLDSFIIHHPSFLLTRPFLLHPFDTKAKAALAVNQNITSSSSLQEVLLQVFEALKDAVPQLWINFAADVSDLWGLRCGFVAGSEKLFNDRKDLLERLITIRSLYTCTLLRDLALLKKTNFESTVNLLASSLQVDLTNVLKVMAAAATADPKDGDAIGENLDHETASKPHPVIALVPGFDSLQSILVSTVWFFIAIF